MYVCMSTCYSAPSRFLLSGAPNYSADTEVEVISTVWNDQKRIRGSYWSTFHVILGAILINALFLFLQFIFLGDILIHAFIIFFFYRTEA